MIPVPRDPRRSPLEPAALSAAIRDLGSPDVLAARLFGSHATGRPHRESDVDVAVLLSRHLDGQPVSRFASASPPSGRPVSACGTWTSSSSTTRRLHSPGGSCSTAGSSGAAIRRRPTLSGATCTPSCGSRTLARENAPAEARGARIVTYLVERLVELRRHLDHLESDSKALLRLETEARARTGRRRRRRALPLSRCGRPR